MPKNSNHTYGRDWYRHRQELVPRRRWFVGSFEKASALDRRDAAGGLTFRRGSLGSAAIKAELGSLCLTEHA
jgi:hypothetical protein